MSMLTFIFLIVLVLSAGGLVFLVVGKIPILAAYSPQALEAVEAETLTPEAVLAQEKIKLLSRKFLIFGAQKAIFLLRWLAKVIQKISEKTKLFYHRQRRREDVQEDVVKKQEEIAQNGDYWHVIRYGLLKVKGRKKKEKIKKQQTELRNNLPPE